MKAFRERHARRRGLLDPAIQPNAAHAALARLEREWPGDVLVVFGQRGLQDGAEVRIVEPPADDAAQSAPQPAGDSP